MSSAPSSPAMPSAPSPKAKWRRTAIAVAVTSGIAVVAAGAVSAHWERGGWRSQSDSGFERHARVQRFCGSDTARYHPVLRAFVRADLRLNQAQAAEFERLADLVLPALEDLKREACNDFVTRGGPAPERVAHLAAILRKAADAAERAVEPSRTFYTALSDEQKSRVDELTEPRHRRPGSR
jgi:hypothetical protein